MKALSIQQPWAYLIVHGFKDIENRRWKTSFRGPLLIHASKKIDYDGYRFVKGYFPSIELPPPESIGCGGIVGKVDMVDCLTWSGSPWFFGPFGFVMLNAKTVPFRPFKGALGFFEVEEPASISK